MKEKIKNKLLYKRNVMVLFIFIILMIGIGYAWFKLTLQGSKTQVLRAGSLNIVLEDCELLLEKAIPQSDTDGLNNVACHFEIKNQGTVDSDYTVYLDDEDILTTDVRMKDSAVRYSLVKTGEEETVANTKLLSTTGENPNRIITTGTVEGKTTIGYDLKIWIDKDATNEVMGTIFNGVLRVEAGQKKEINMPSFAMTKLKDGPTDVVFQSKIEKPAGASVEYDISEAQDGSVMQYIAPDSETGTYKTYVQANGKFLLPEDSSYFFQGKQSIEGIELLDTSRVTNMSGMFYTVTMDKSIDLSHFDTSNVTDMSNMFYDTKFNSIIFGDWDTSSVTDMNSMFMHSSVTSLSFGDWDTSSVTNMSDMFRNAESIKVLDLSFMEGDSIETTNAMFGTNTSLTSLNLSNLTLTNINGLFNSTNNLETLIADNLTILDSSYTLYGGSSLKTISMKNLYLPNVTSLSANTFRAPALENLDLSNLNAPNLTSISQLTYSYTNVKKLNISNNNTPKLTDLSNAFYRTKMETLDLSHFNTTGVTSMDWMFFGCENLKSLDLSGMDVSSVTNMDFMFASIPLLKTLDLSTFNFNSSVTTSKMFNSSSNLTTIYVKNSDSKNIIDTAISDSEISAISQIK